MHANSGWGGGGGGGWPMHKTSEQLGPIILGIIIL